MTTAFQAADAVLALINSQPRTPTREAIAAAIAGQYDAAQERGEVHSHGRASDVQLGNVTPASAADIGLSRKLSAEGRAFMEAAEWEVGLMRASTKKTGLELTRCIFAEAHEARERVERTARRVWARPAAGLEDVAARAVVAAYLRWDGFADKRWLDAGGRMRSRFWNEHCLYEGDGAEQLIAAVERVTGVRRLRCDP
jgi:hypothetical protein